VKIVQGERRCTVTWGAPHVSGAQGSAIGARGGAPGVPGPPIWQDAREKEGDHYASQSGRHGLCANKWDCIHSCSRMEFLIEFWV